MKTGIIGSGAVGKALATGFIQNGYQVMAGSRDPHKLDSWKKEISAELQTGDPVATAAFGELVVLAVRGTAAEAVVRMVGTKNLAGKTVLDTTNPIAGGEPVNGVLTYFTSPGDSLMERLQRIAPEARFVKAFNSVGAHLMVAPALPDTPTMFICGNSEDAKQEARTIMEQFGWDVEDMGKVEAARAIEPLAMLWCIPGFRENRWSHAFKLLKA